MGLSKCMQGSPQQAHYPHNTHLAVDWLCLADYSLNIFPDGSDQSFSLVYLYNAMKHIFTGISEQIGGMSSESSKVVMGMIAILWFTKSQF